MEGEGTANRELVSRIEEGRTVTAHREKTALLRMGRRFE